MGLAQSPDLDVDWVEDHYELALFDDVRGLVGDDAIEALPDWLGQQEGIDEAIHADREVIEVYTSSTRWDTATLAHAVICQLAVTGDETYWDDPTGGS